MGRSRYTFARNPEIYLGNGLPISPDNEPSVMSLRTFFNGIIDDVFITENPPKYHHCNDMCEGNLQIVIANPDKLVKDIVPRNGDHKVIIEIPFCIKYTYRIYEL